MSHIEIISASAGSGKTYRLSQILLDEIESGNVRPEAVLATTFTKKAAAELQERVRHRLLSANCHQKAQQLGAAWIGTVNSVCGRLVNEFAFELGLSPRLDVLDEKLAEQYMNEALADAVTLEEYAQLESLSRSLDWGQSGGKKYKAPDAATSWTEARKEVVRLAQTNGISTDELRRCAGRSVETFLSLFPDPVDDGDKLDVALSDALEEFVRTFDEEDRKGTIQTKKSRDAAAICRRGLAQARRGRGIPWRTWPELARASVAKAHQPLNAALDLVVQAASKHEQHPRLHEDIRRVTELVFEMSARGLDRYAAYKRELGVIDFADQEALALKLLDDEEVQQRLRGRIDLLLVDEFQDTSPIQLAIFLKIASLAKRTVWVGDQKQSIFGFRGTDPAIMDAAIDAVLGGEEPETLRHSWRSRPGLVSLTSDLFAEAFPHHDISADRVRLEPPPTRQSEPEGLGSFVERWVLAGNKGEQHAEVAAGIRDLLGDSALVRDEDPSTTRPLRRGDIGVLCRSNRNCRSVATHLGRLGIPAVLAQPGLMKTPEGAVALAAVRLFVDPGDSLAKAQIARFVDDPTYPEKWLETALSNPYAKGFDSVPAIARILEARKLHRTAGATAILDAAIDAADLRGLCHQWGDAPHRLANLDRLRAHAASHASITAAAGKGVTATGLIHHLDQIADAEADEQATLASLDAVTVSTWHRAKGLEWPVTILHDLGGHKAGNALGIHVDTDHDSFDLAAPLADRWIRYWPYPYGGISSGIPLISRLAQVPEQQAVVDRHWRQELRLLYVGWTRARDRVILASGTKDFSKGVLKLISNDQGPLLDEPADGTATWVGHTFPVAIRTPVPAAPVPRIRQPGEFARPQGPADHPPALVYPSESERTGRIGERNSLGDRIPITGDPDMSHLGEAIHGFFAAERTDMSDDRRLVLAQGLLERWSVDGSVEPDKVVQACANLTSWIDTKYPGARWFQEWPIRHRLPDGSVVRGFVDLVVEIDEGFVVIDHKSFPGTLTEEHKKVKGYAGQLGVYGEALSAAEGKPVLAGYIHLPVSGEMVEVSWTETV